MKLLGIVCLLWGLLFNPHLAHGLIAFEMYTDATCNQLLYAPPAAAFWGKNNDLSAPLMVPLTNQCNFCGNTLVGVTYTKVDSTGVRWCSHPNPPTSGSPCDAAQGSCVDAPLNTCTTACGPNGVVNGKFINVPNDGIIFVVLGGNSEEVSQPNKCEDPRSVSWYARYYYEEQPTCNTTAECLGPREYVRDNGQVWYCESFVTTTCNTATNMCENLHDCHVSAMSLNTCGNVNRGSSGLGVPPGVTDGTGSSSGSYYVTRLTSNDGNSFPLPQQPTTTPASAPGLAASLLTTGAALVLLVLAF